MKIQDREVLETPHITVRRKTTCCWRFDLRERAFMDREPDPSEVPAEIIGLIRMRYDELVDAWDRIHPTNRVSGRD